MTNILTERTRKDQVMMYHGTSSTFLRSILKNGIVPNPNERLWSGDSEKTSVLNPSKESIPNSSYWTTNFGTAYASAGRTVDRHKGNRLIVIGLMMPESMIGDEDDVSYIMEGAIDDSGIFGWGTFEKAMQVRAILNVNPNNTVIQKILDNAHQNLIIIKRLPETTRKPEKNFFMQWLEKTLDRILSYYTEYSVYDMKREYQKGLEFDHRITKEEEDQLWEPEWFEKHVLSTFKDPKTAEKDLITFFDTVTRKYKNLAKRSRMQSVSSFATARITDTVAFSGRNRIVCIFSIRENERKDDWRNDYDMVVHYGTLPKEVESEFSIRITNQYRVVDERSRNRPQKIHMEHVDRIVNLLNEEIELSDKYKAFAKSLLQMSDVVQTVRDKWLNQGMTIQQINSGYCDEFANEVIERAEYFGFDCEEMDTEYMDNVPEHLSGHVWVYCNDDGKHYDVEKPYGVDDWMLLPYFQRAIMMNESKRISTNPDDYAEYIKGKTYSGNDIIEYVRWIGGHHYEDEETDVEDRIVWSPHVLRDVPLDDLDLEGFETFEDDIDDWIEFYKTQGFMPPIITTQLKSGWSNEIIDGNHRANAMKKMGFDTVPAFVPTKSLDESKTDYPYFNRERKKRGISHNYMDIFLYDRRQSKVIPELSVTATPEEAEEESNEGGTLTDLTEGVEFPITDYRDQKAIEKANANGGDVINDGNKYIICAHRRGNNSSVMTTMNKGTAQEQVKYFKSQRDVVRIAVIKGNNQREYIRLDNGTWTIGNEKIMEEGGTLTDLTESLNTSNIRDAVISAIEDGTWRDAYDCLYPENEDDDRDCYFQSKQSYEAYIDDVVSFFEDLPDEFYVYRSIYANSKEDVDVGFPGEFWTVNASTALNFGSHARNNFVMRGWVRKQDIDLEQSIRTYIEFSDLSNYDSEFEITIPDADVVVHDIEVFTNKEAKKMSEHEEFVQPRHAPKIVESLDLKEAFLLEKRRSSFEVLQDNKIALTKEERQEVMDAKAVWHHGPNGEETPAVWKSKDSKGKIVYVTNTHRAYRSASTLKGAIKEFHDFIKGTA